MRMILVEECSEVDTIECPLIIGLQWLYLRPSLATGHPHPDSFPEKKKLERFLDKRQISIHA